MACFRIESQLGITVVALVYLAAYLHPRQVFYSILVDRFANGDITNDNSNLVLERSGGWWITWERWFFLLKCWVVVILEITGTVFFFS